METLLVLASSPDRAAAAMWTPGIWELIVILVIVLVVFGPGKLPQIGEALGKSIKSFKKASETREEIDVTPKQLDEPRPTVDTQTAATKKDEQPAGK